ncbi:MAG: hypothetical protein HGB30_09650 [Holophagaceae bacterium]|nr:hypothetical protein [Holophagaceae bacterium]
MTDEYRWLGSFLDRAGPFLAFKLGDHPDHPNAFLGKPFGDWQLREAASQAVIFEETPP